MRKEAAHADNFVVLLKGLYQPVVHGPNLGLSSVDLSDGTYSTTKIYPVCGTPGNTNLDTAIGDFYVQFTAPSALCAYHIPGGSFAMHFTGEGSDNFFVPDEAGTGQFLIGTFELDVIEGTGIYRSIVGGHNHMDDLLHFCSPMTGTSSNTASASSPAHNTGRDQIPTEGPLRRAVRLDGMGTPVHQQGDPRVVDEWLRRQSVTRRGSLPRPPEHEHECRHHDHARRDYQRHLHPSP